VRILGVDTATPRASVALVEDGALLGEEVYGGTEDAAHGAASQPRKNHAEIILPLIHSVLANAHMTVADLSGIAVSIGPGSFTGLRIGLATAKGIAYGWGLPAVGISTLLATGATALAFDGTICVLLDARKSEVYLGFFRREGKTISAVSDESVTSISSAVDLMRKYTSNGSSLLAIGEGAKAYERFLIDSLGASLTLAPSENLPSVASQVALLAQERIGVGSVDDLGALAPVYLRRSEAENKKNLIPSR
jgi:tRNA threonylcarbamoyladenosine biosynthesis protein TsaB